tara:strand:- start:2166 stop:2603 length:438 start_codon:yes stop_codon:yes gene_type:complete
METNTNVENKFGNFYGNRRHGHSKKEIYNRDFNERQNLSIVQITETDSSYHFELKIPGYIKDDFNFYISRDDLVVTTEKRKEIKTNQATKNIVSSHSYCYPSAYFKRTFQLPPDIARDEIFVDYKDKILSFDLYKSENAAGKKMR